MMASFTNFGKLPFGYSISGQVYHNSTNNIYGCDKFENYSLGSEHENKIVIVDR